MLQPGRPDAIPDQEAAVGSLSVVCCTRNRPEDLARLIASVVRARRLAAGVRIEVVVIDDGELDGPCQSALAAMVEDAAMAWRYHRKQGAKGLLLSRIEALAVAAHDWILFLDDDVELEGSYLARLVEIIRRRPNLAGIGGVDVLFPPNSAARTFACYLVGLEPRRLGALSFSGFPSNMGRVLKAREAFASRRLYGCNMTFRKAALQGLRPLPGFEGYSLYEDAYLSAYAERSGELLIDPALRVEHHHSPVARDAGAAVGRMSILNHYCLMRFAGASRLRAPGLVVSALGLILLSTLRAVRFRRAGQGWMGLDYVRGQLGGLVSLLAALPRADAAAPAPPEEPAPSTSPKS
jgi:glycosyltransferase involved in cell wall biosynthesis